MLKVGDRIIVRTGADNVYVGEWEGLTGVVVRITASAIEVEYDRNPPNGQQPVMHLTGMSANWLKPYKETAFQKDLRNYLDEELR